MSPPIDMTKHYTVDECAKIADVTPGTIRVWMRDNEFQWVRKNRKERLAVAESFDAFMDSLHNPTVQHTA